MSSQAATETKPLSFPVRVGTMGWGYTDWLGSFYPTDAASRDFIAHYARTFPTVEIDSTFYGTPREAQVTAWRKATPESFRFCPKVPRLITHELRLLNAADELKRFVEVMGRLEAKRGPMLLQFPPDFTRAELDSLKAFLPVLSEPEDSTARFAIEFRHRSLIGPDVSGLLKSYRVALAAVDYVSMPRRYELTTDFVYLRLIGKHGAFPEHRRAQRDRTPEIRRWADLLRDTAGEVSDAYVFCNNDYEGFSPATAEKLQRMLGLEVSAWPANVQGTLF